MKNPMTTALRFYKYCPTLKDENPVTTCKNIIEAEIAKGHRARCVKNYVWAYILHKKKEHRPNNEFSDS
jgi:hypothetical protein